MRRGVRARKARAVRNARAVLAHEVLRARSEPRLGANIAEVDALAGNALLPSGTLDVRATAHALPGNALLIGVALN